MERETRLARLFWAESGKTQEQYGNDLEIHPSTIRHYLSGKLKPSPEHLERMAAGTRLTVAAGEEILRISDTLQRPRLRQGRGDLFAGLGEPLRSRARRAYQRLLRLPPPDRLPSPEDRLLAQEQLALLEGFATHEQRSTVVGLVRACQNRALCELAAGTDDFLAARLETIQGLLNGSTGAR